MSALCKLLSAQYPRITTILVKGDRIDEEPGRMCCSFTRLNMYVGIVTRSRARVERWTEVSAPVKALKLLIAEYMSEDENETVIPGVGDLSADTSFEADEDDDVCLCYCELSQYVLGGLGGFRHDCKER